MSGLAGVAPRVDVGSSQRRRGCPTCTPGAGSTPATPAGASGGGWQDGSSTCITQAQLDHNIAAYKAKPALVDLWHMQDIHCCYTQEQQEQNMRIGKLMLGSSMPVRLRMLSTYICCKTAVEWPLSHSGVCFAKVDAIDQGQHVFRPASQTVRCFVKSHAVDLLLQMCSCVGAAISQKKRRLAS